MNGLVFTMPDGAPIQENKFEYYFRKSRNSAGIKDFTFHDFRHCAITRWATAGAPTAAGHKKRREPQEISKSPENPPKGQFPELEFINGT